MEESLKYLLWENISAYIEKTEELKLMLKNISYVDDKELEKITRCEVLDTDDFYILNIRDTETCVRVEFEMPFILSCWGNGKGRLRVTANVIGKCELPSQSCFDYTAVDFSKMNKIALLSYENMIVVENVKYTDIEVDIYGW